ncbi:acid protease [Mycena latifolia]|nr:acid protease [Mycena latifolia]
MTFLSIISIVYLFGAANAEFNFVQHRALAPCAQQEPTRRCPRPAAVLSPSTLTGLTLKAYLTNVTVGGQNFSFIVDTGSVDTSVVQKGFSCFDSDGNPMPQSTCAFGTPGFDIKASKTFQPFPNVSANLTYGNGFSLNGSVGFDTVTVGELSVAHQVIAVPNVAAYVGDGIFSGLLFLVFSVALDRGTFEQEANDRFDPNLGFLSFGGIAPVPVVNTSVTVPIQGYSIANSSVTSSATPSDCPGAEFLFYTIDIESYTFPGSTGLATTSNNTILDTGTALNVVPADVAAAYAAAFNPPAILTPVPNSTTELYVVDCKAEVPEFLVTIGGTTFSIDARDQIVPLAKDDQGNSICPISHLLHRGDVFLQNVVATFNPIADEVTLTQRAKY